MSVGPIGMKVPPGPLNNPLFVAPHPATRHPGMRCQLIRRSATLTILWLSGDSRGILCSCDSPGSFPSSSLDVGSEVVSLMALFHAVVMKSR